MTIIIDECLPKRLRSVSNRFADLAHFESALQDAAGSIQPGQIIHIPPKKRS